MRIVQLPVVLTTLITVAASAAPQMQNGGPTLTLPDGSVLRLPPGTHAFGPAGPMAPPAAEAPPVAGVPPAAGSGQAAPADPPLSVAERRKRRLDDLYERLAQAKDAAEAQSIGGMIADVLLHSGSDTADLLMERVMAAIGTKDYTTAGALLDRIVVLRPRWAEAWNKRATVRFLGDDDAGAMADISQVLVLEPRHFGALSGMGMILHRNGNDKAAITVLRKALAINPQDAQVKQMVDELAPEVDGQAL